LCLRLLTARARTRAELAGQLTKRGYPDDVSAAVLDRLSKTEGCTGILFPNPSHPEILKVVAATAETRGLKKAAEGNNFQLLVSSL